MFETDEFLGSFLYCGACQLPKLWWQIMLYVLRIFYFT